MAFRKSTRTFSPRKSSTNSPMKRPRRTESSSEGKEEGFTRGGRAFSSKSNAPKRSYSSTFSRGQNLRKSSSDSSRTETDRRENRVTRNRSNDSYRKDESQSGTERKTTRRYSDRTGFRKSTPSADRPERSYSKDRPERSYSKDRPERSYSKDRPERSYSKDRPERSYSKDRPERSYSKDRPERSYSKDRPERSYSKDRPERSYSKDRPERSYSKDRPERSYSKDRPERSYSKDRPERSYSRNRAERGFDEKSPRSSSVDSRSRSPRTSNKFDDAKPRRSGRSAERTYGDKNKSFSPKKRFTESDNSTFNSDSHPEKKVGGSDEVLKPTRNPSKAKTNKVVPTVEPTKGKETVAKKKTKKSPEKVGTRINKYLADSGVASRRAVEQLIIDGEVKVNRKVVTDLSTRIVPGDFVTVKGEPITDNRRMVYLLLNKPKDVITTADDELGRKTVLDLVKTDKRLFPVGRLDRNTTGVLLLTNDGELAHRLTHPSYSIARVYNVTLDKPLEHSHAQRIANGVTLEDGDQTQPCEILIDPTDARKVILELREGKNREVRRIFEKFGYDVRKLDRKFFATLSTRGLARGTYRALTRRELSELRQLTDLEE